MSLSDALQILFWVTFSVVAGYWVVRGYWRARSEIRRRAEGAPPLQSSRTLVWRQPGPLNAAEIEAGPSGARGAPAPPFHFVEEHDTGSQPCVSVRDASNRVWWVKWGQEVHTEVFGTRLAWAFGYFAEPSYFLAHGAIEGARDLRRAKACIDEQAAFKEARFELDEKGVTKHFDAHGWAWNDNPFIGSPELSGLKILMMLMSNWDNKDVRDVSRGSNTAIFECRTDKGGLEARYLIIDWGAALGTWGNNPLQRALASRGVRRAERCVHHRRRRRSCEVGLPGSAHHRRGRAHHARTPALVRSHCAHNQRRSFARGVARERGDRGGDRAVHGGTPWTARPDPRDRGRAGYGSLVSAGVDLPFVRLAGFVFNDSGGVRCAARAHSIRSAGLSTISAGTS